MTIFFLNLPDKIFCLSNPFSKLFRYEISSIVSFFYLSGSGLLTKLNPDQIRIRSRIRNTGSPYLESLLPLFLAYCAQLPVRRHAVPEYQHGIFIPLNSVEFQFAVYSFYQSEKNRAKAGCHRKTPSPLNYQHIIL